MWEPYSKTKCCDTGNLSVKNAEAFAKRATQCSKGSCYFGATAPVQSAGSRKRSKRKRRKKRKRKTSKRKNKKIRQNGGRLSLPSEYFGQNSGRYKVSYKTPLVGARSYGVKAGNVLGPQLGVDKFFYGKN